MNNKNNLPISSQIPIARQISSPLDSPNDSPLDSPNDIVIQQSLTPKPISSDNILIVNLNMNTNGGSIGQNIRYMPEMSNPQVYAEYPDILFIPTIKLEENIFNQTVETIGYLGSIDKRKIFLSPALFSNFIATIQNKYKYKKITLKDAKTKGIINHNIMFILNLFFGKGRTIKWSDITYTIYNYKWNSGFKEDNIEGKQSPIYRVTVDVQLIKGDSPSFVDFARTGCLAKKNDIINHYFELTVKNKDDDDTNPIDSSGNKMKGGKRKKSRRLAMTIIRKEKGVNQYKRKITNKRTKK